MKIGIIGAGNVGTGVGKRLAAHGHDILVAFAKSEAGLAEAATAIGAAARTGSVEEAARCADIVLLATPWPVTEMAIQQANGALDGKIIWDCTNPLKPDFSGLSVGLTDSGGEQVARWAAGATVVKAIPPFAELLHQPGDLPESQRPSVFVCGDDGIARLRIAELVAQIGADPIDAGPLAWARYAEPSGMLLVQLAYVKGMGAKIGARLLR